MLRLLSDEDIKIEYRDRLTKSIWCPALERYQLLIFCFACSRFNECKVPKENEILDLTVEDVMLDPASLAKSMSARIVKSEIVSHLPKKRKASKVKKAPANTGQSNKKARSKKDVVLAYLKEHPDADVPDIMKSCCVSRTYARKVLSERT